MSSKAETQSQMTKSEIRMPNAECRMPNEARMTKLTKEPPVALFGLRHSFVIRHLSFVIDQ